MNESNHGSIISAVLWMLLISVLLFWLPFIGPLIAGFVGGKKAGGYPGLSAITKGPEEGGDVVCTYETYSDTGSITVTGFAWCTR